MHGNVWEWVEDCWNESYQGAPSDGSAWTSGDCNPPGAARGLLALRSGILRSASRYGDGTDDRDNGIGFRVARMYCTTAPRLASLG
jgi:formylglycine-generating enzyme required for sulfatase activity